MLAEPPRRLACGFLEFVIVDSNVFRVCFYLRYGAIFRNSGSLWHETIITEPWHDGKPEMPLDHPDGDGSTDPADLTDLGDLISMKDLADLENLISPTDPARRPDRLEVSKMRSKAMAQNH